MRMIRPIQTRSLYRLALGAALSIFLPATVRAVPSFYPEAAPKDMKTCNINKEANKTLLSAMKMAAPGFAPAISSTTYSVAVIRVDFSDRVMTKSLHMSSTFFAEMQAFYRENSYNVLTVTAVVTNGGAGGQGAYRMPRTLATYANGINSSYGLLARDAVAVATAAGFNFSSFDHIMIYHSGEGSETGANATQQNGTLWSVYAPASALNIPTVNGKNFAGATFVPEYEYTTSGNAQISPLGVTCHEYGHQLGLPDLYENTSVSAVGKWSLMDAGVYLPNPGQSGNVIGSNPAHLDAWSKLFLGFSIPETISVTQAVNRTLSPAETTRTAFFRLPVTVSDVGSSNEYFLLEYRRTSGASYDNYLPQPGLLIWHIDDSIASNASRLAANNVNALSSRRGVDLVQADGSDPSSNGGDTGDPWPGTTILFKSPDSNSYSGQASGIEVTNISAGGNPTVSLSINTPFTNPAITSDTSINNVIITGGLNGYTNPNKNESALIAMRPSVSGRIEIKIYNASGDLVWETTAAASANNQTVVSWNGKNSDGIAASSGIYLVHINGAGIETKKKLALVR